MATNHLRTVVVVAFETVVISYIHQTMDNVQHNITMTYRYTDNSDKKNNEGFRCALLLSYRPHKFNTSADITIFACKVDQTS
jgi:hypothetical protein